jgi:hypothetical protein
MAHFHIPHWHVFKYLAFFNSFFYLQFASRQKMAGKLFKAASLQLKQMSTFVSSSSFKHSFIRNSYYFAMRAYLVPMDMKDNYGKLHLNPGPNLTIFEFTAITPAL